MRVIARVQGRTAIEVDTVMVNVSDEEALSLALGALRMAPPTSGLELIVVMGAGASFSTIHLTGAKS